MIPKIAHIICIGKDAKKLNKKLLITLSSITKHMPDYLIKVWTEENIDIEKLPSNIKELYYKGEYAFVVDYLRCDVIYNYGGWYFDVGVEVFKNVKDIQNNGVVFCDSEMGYIVSHSFAASKNNSLIGKLRDAYLYDSRSGKRNKNHPLNMEIWTNIIKEEKGIFFLKAVAFIPYVLGRDGTIEDIRKKITDETYLTKYFSYTWQRGIHGFLHRTYIGGKMLDVMHVIYPKYFE